MQHCLFLCHINKIKLIRFTNSGWRLSRWLLSAYFADASYNVCSSHQRSSTITAVFMDPILWVWISNPSCCFQRLKRLQRIRPQLLEAARQKISSLHLCYNLLICFMKKHHYQTQLFCMDKGWWLFIGMNKRPFADSSQSAALLIMHHLCIFELLPSCNCARAAASASNISAAGKQFPRCLCEISRQRITDKESVHCEPSHVRAARRPLAELQPSLNRFQTTRRRMPSVEVVRPPRCLIRGSAPSPEC